MPAALPAAHEEQLTRLVRESTGIRLHDHQLETLRRTVTEGCARFGHEDLDSYIDALGRARPASPEYEHLIAGITVGESYFFRDQAQMNFLRDTWLPALIARRRQEGNLFLRIWSAGCSDGQELYSIALLLAGLLPDLERWNLHLLGTDLNVTALARAVQARYSEWSLRATPDAERQRFFRQEADGAWVLSPALRRLGRFAYLNLREDCFPSILSETVALDLILCRNVFIYFDPAVVNQVMAKFHASLAPGGCLLLGASDLVDSSRLDGFSLRQAENTSYLVRAEAAPPPAAPLPRPRSRAPGPKPAAPPAHPPDEAPSPVPARTRLIHLLGSGAWAEALEQTLRSQEAGDDSALVWQFRAKALANLGRGREALEACDASLQRDTADKHTYFLRAMVLLELHRLPEAEEALRRTLYLDRDFLEAHYQLALLQMRRGERQAGLKSMRNALAIAERTTPERRLHDAAGRDHERMAAILRHELCIYTHKGPHGGTAP